LNADFAFRWVIIACRFTRGSDIQQIFEELSRAFGFRGFDDIFRESYGAGYRTFEFRHPGVFGRIIVGGFGQAQDAGASGAPVGYLEKLIRYGLKKKWGIELPERGNNLHDFIMLSPDVARRGGKVQHVCSKTGRKLLINIPPDTKAGQQLRLKGMGEAGRAGGEAGDLYITIRVRSGLIKKAENLITAIKSMVKSR